MALAIDESVRRNRGPFSCHDRARISSLVFLLRSHRFPTLGRRGPPPLSPVSPVCRNHAAKFCLCLWIGCRLAVSRRKRASGHESFHSRLVSCDPPIGGITACRSDRRASMAEWAKNRRAPISDHMAPHACRRRRGSAGLSRHQPWRIYGHRVGFLACR